MSKVENTVESDGVSAVGVTWKTMAGSGPDSTEICFQSHFPSDMSELEINEFMDKFASVLERQRIVGEIPKHKEDVAMCIKNIAGIEDDVERIAATAQADWEKAGHNGPAKINKSNQSAREACSVNLNEWKARLVKAENLLLEARTLRAIVSEENTEVVAAA